MKTRARSDKTKSHPHLGVPCAFSELKRKNYIEHTPEPKDYAGDSDWESYMSPGS